MTAAADRNFQPENIARSIDLDANSRHPFGLLIASPSEVQALQGWRKLYFTLMSQHGSTHLKVVLYFGEPEPTSIALRCLSAVYGAVVIGDRANMLRSLDLGPLNIRVMGTFLNGVTMTFFWGSEFSPFLPRDPKISTTLSASQLNSAPC